MAHFSKTGSLAQFQEFTRVVYAKMDDQHYSLWDLLTHEQRFAMRALKGIRKENKAKLTVNLVIAFTFLFAIANRLHINVEEEVWKRFPSMCSYCGSKPCQCKRYKVSKRQKVVVDTSKKPGSLAGYQKMFERIYPASERTLIHAGIHLAEEVGEVTEAIQNFLGQHFKKQFVEVELELADCISCIFGIANSADIDMAKELAKTYSDNCHVCHALPCACGFSKVVLFKS